MVAAGAEGTDEGTAMLTLGNGFTVDNVNFFRDDEVKDLFYFLPTKLRLATGPDGSPAFQFTLYQIGLPIQGKEQGGGFLMFTVQLTEDQDLIDGQAKQQATNLLRNETPVGEPVPTPRFQSVPFIGGTANLLIAQGGGQLVRNIQLSRPSLFGRNAVAVVADMPFEGAQVFADTLRQGGAIASIEYNLDFEVRLPAVVIEAFISASQTREVVATFVEDEVVDEDFWGGDTTTPVRHRTGYSETLEQHDLVQLSIKPGSSEVELDDEVVADLRDFALGAMNSYIENEWMAGTGGVLTEQQLQSEWLEFINEDFHRDFTMNMTQSDVIVRQYGASAEVSPDFVGAEPKDFLIIVDTLAHPFFHRLTVPVSTSFDFTAHDDYVHSIVVSLHYSSRGADGRQVEKSESFIFSKDDPDPKTFITAKGRAQDNEFEVVAEVHYKNGPVASRRLFSRRQVDPVVVVDVENPGLLEVTFNTPETAFEGELKAIEVEFEYADPANDVERFTESRVLAKDTGTTVQIRHPIYTTTQRDFKSRFTHVFATQRSTGPWLSGGPETKQGRVRARSRGASAWTWWPPPTGTSWKASWCRCGTTTRRTTSSRRSR